MQCNRWLKRDNYTIIPRRLLLLVIFEPCVIERTRRRLTTLSTVFRRIMPAGSGELIPTSPAVYHGWSHCSLIVSFQGHRCVSLYNAHRVVLCTSVFPLQVCSSRHCSHVRQLLRSVGTPTLCRTTSDLYSSARNDCMSLKKRRTNRSWCKVYCRTCTCSQFLDWLLQEQHLALHAQSYDCASCLQH